MRILDLFSGVGMFSYAFKKLDWEIAAFVEQDKWCQRVLAMHNPGVPIYNDVRDITSERLETDGITGIDVICGGFPCQDLSVAGKQAGITGERSGLWGEFARIISEIRPRNVIVENVSALLSGDSGRWFQRVLGDLAEIGFDAEWHVIPAGNPKGLSAGAPHRRDRVWIVAYPKHDRTKSGKKSEVRQGRTIQDQHRQHKAQKRQRYELECRARGNGLVVNPASDHRNERPELESNGRENKTEQVGLGSRGSDVAHPESQRRGETRNTITRPEKRVASSSSESINVGHTERKRQPRPGQPVNTGNQTQGGEGQTNHAVNVGEREVGTTEPGLGLLAHGIAAELSGSRWLPEPGIGRVATGVPDRVNKLKALGNGLVWQIPYAIGKAIMERQ